jgi:hypothetical protein
MIDPASTGDWMLALLMAAALGGLGGSCAWALRQEHLDRDTLQPVLTARGERPLASAAVRQQGASGPSAPGPMRG